MRKMKYTHGEMGCKLYAEADVQSPAEFGHLVSRYTDGRERAEGPEGRGAPDVNNQGTHS